MLTPVVVPEGIDDFRVRSLLLQDFGIEIGAAFGPLLGRVWRIGTMGCSATRQNVLLCLAALEDVLRREGWRVGAGAGIDAALEYYAAARAEAPQPVSEVDSPSALGASVAPR
jgi:(S)-ureidoglycine-glyoxylate aminotransferase